MFLHFKHSHDQSRRNLRVSRHYALWSSIDSHLPRRPISVGYQKIAKAACPESFLPLKLQIIDRGTSLCGQLHFPSAAAGQSSFRSDEPVNRNSLTALEKVSPEPIDSSPFP